jgi:hypothetical protein
MSELLNPQLNPSAIVKLLLQLDRTVLPWLATWPGNSSSAHRVWVLQRQTLVLAGVLQQCVRAYGMGDLRNAGPNDCHRLRLPFCREFNDA